MYQHEHKDIFPWNHDYSLGALIWKASKTHNDIKLCREGNTIIVLDIRLKSLKAKKNNWFELLNNFHVHNENLKSPLWTTLQKVLHQRRTLWESAKMFWEGMSGKMKCIITKSDWDGNIFTRKRCNKNMTSIHLNIILFKGSHVDFVKNMFECGLGWANIKRITENSV